MQKDSNSNFNDLSIIDLWYLFKNHILLIISTTVVFLFSLSIYAWIIVTPKYISNADVMIQVEQSSSGNNETNFDFVNAFRLIDTVAELMEKDIVLKNSVERLKNLGYENIDIEYLKDGLNVTSSSSSYFINISFIDENKVLAKDAVNSVIDAVIEETDIEDAFPVLTDKIRRTSFANEPTYHSPNQIIYAFAGVFLGLITSFGFIIFREKISSYFVNKEDIESNLDLIVLGVIPKMNPKEINHAKR
jgi:capsular polysaccharide biosynthesis protein